MTGEGTKEDIYPSCWVIPVLLFIDEYISDGRHQPHRIILWVHLLSLSMKLKLFCICSIVYATGPNYCFSFLPIFIGIYRRCCFWIWFFREICFFLPLIMLLLRQVRQTTSMQPVVRRTTAPAPLINVFLFLDCFARVLDYGIICSPSAGLHC